MLTGNKFDKLTSKYIAFDEMIWCQGLIVSRKFIFMDINLVIGVEIVKLNSTSIFSSYTV